jgi:hypothetical protein
MIQSEPEAMASATTSKDAASEPPIWRDLSQILKRD